MGSVPEVRRWIQDRRLAVVQARSSGGPLALITDGSVDSDKVQVSRDKKHIRVYVEYATPPPGGHAYTFITADGARALGEALIKLADDADADAGDA